ncbi:hypothetical protein I6F20_34045 [Bradyrhizobium sp. IC3123]|nr:MULTISPECIES: hypothetical protein [unclassified Bradyrhizobium]MCA1394038.1 hypothetical protein [Bradyrhizobium sp. IC3123]MCA1501356.1 hypothetical protein [Bradyrhizobium sp. NBAIM14]
MVYFTAFLIVVVLSAVASFRRSRTLSQNSQGAASAQRLKARQQALWPAMCAAIFALALLAFHHVQDKQDFGPSVALNLAAFTAAFLGGWFLGVIGGMDWD